MDNGEYRTCDQLNSKFKDMNGKVQKFAGIYNNVCNSWRSGSSESDIRRTAHERYRAEVRAPFIHEAVWEVLKMSPKWAPVGLMDPSDDRPSKRSKSSASTEKNTLSSDGRCHINVNEVTIDEEEDEHEVQAPQRPPGRNKGKQKMRSSKVQEEGVKLILDEIKIMSNKNEEYRLKKLDLIGKNSTTREKECELQLRQQEKDDWEFVISSEEGLTDDMLRAVRKRKQQIRIRYGWD